MLALHFIIYTVTSIIVTRKLNWFKSKFNIYMLLKHYFLRSFLFSYLKFSACIHINMLLTNVYKPQICFHNCFSRFSNIPWISFSSAEKWLNLILPKRYGPVYHQLWHTRINVLSNNSCRHARLAGTSIKSPSIERMSVKLNGKLCCP